MRRKRGSHLLIAPWSLGRQLNTDKKVVGIKNIACVIIKVLELWRQKGEIGQ